MVQREQEAAAQAGKDGEEKQAEESEVKAFEFTAEVQKLFTCIVGEPRAWTCNPPRSHIPVIEEPVDDGLKHWYAVFGYQCKECTEEELVNALYRDFLAMRGMCSGEDKPTLIWRRMPMFIEEGVGRNRFKRFHSRLVIPQLAFGAKREAWLKIPSMKNECEAYPQPR